MQDKTLYKIADVATLVGVAAETLRQWEKHGLFTPSRSASGHRFYDASHVASARVIARYRMEEGLSLSDIRTAMTEPANRLAPKTARLSSSQATMPGLRLRRLRNACHISLSQLANDVAISASALSTFERTSQGLSVSVLRRIADHFGVTVTKLTVIPEPIGKPVRRRQTGKMSSLGIGIKVRALATGPQRIMDCKEWTLKPGAQSEGSYRHEGEEFVFVLGGRLDITVDGLGHFRLAPGDSLYFESNRPHAWINEGEVDCLVLWVNTPPSF